MIRTVVNYWIQVVRNTEDTDQEKCVILWESFQSSFLSETKTDVTKWHRGWLSDAKYADWWMWTYMIGECGCTLYTVQCSVVLCTTSSYSPINAFCLYSVLYSVLPASNIPSMAQNFRELWIHGIGIIYVDTRRILIQQKECKCEHWVIFKWPEGSQEFVTSTSRMIILLGPVPNTSFSQYSSILIASNQSIMSLKKWNMTNYFRRLLG